ncbi:MAG TPA: GGDEF domain-containing protein [Tepidisphaeraceae bacterium]|nr:GGDEF domain-containing protein [Tepidisphaeraceae bacterium]
MLALVALVTRLIVRRQTTMQVLKERAETINRLLEFSQTVQGAGRIEQVYPTLSHYLRRELKLSGMIIMTHDSDAMPPTSIASCWPDELVPQGLDSAEIDASLCPCIRQTMPREFQPNGTPVRCVIEKCLPLPKSHAAYCIPFSFGRNVRVTVHLLLKPPAAWTEHRRQLAQAYVNSARAAISGLQLLSDAEKQSMTDALTGLYNRRSLDQLLMREVALAERHGHPLSVVMVDVDHFKAINDAHGHAAGDHLLKAFADCVRITLRKTDLAFRYGGDEFVIALPQTPLAQAEQVLNKLRQAFLSVDFSHAISKLEEQPTLSMGIADRSPTKNVLSAAQIISAADQALYAAKNGDRNCIRVFEPTKAA